MPGFVGHGIGLELDEPPILWPRDEARVQAGMVQAVEIEVSAPAQEMRCPEPCPEPVEGLVEGMVKLEDTVVVRADGHEILTGAPREL